MSQAKTTKIKNGRLSVDGPRFWSIVKMLLANTLKMDFKRDFKKSLIRVIVMLIGFVVVAAVSFVFFYISRLFSLFSVLAKVPQSVPSLIVMAFFFIGFIPALLKLTKSLYFAPDNKILITFPCNGNTIFLARIFVFFVSQLVRTLMIEVAFLAGFMIFSNFKAYCYPWLILAWFLLTAAEVLILSLLSIPTYYAWLFLKKHNIITVFLSIAAFVLIIFAIVNVVMLIPDSISLFNSWGPYQAAIIKFLNGYQNEASFFFWLTTMSMGYLQDNNVRLFTATNVITLLGVIATIVIFLVLCLYVVNPIYFRLASSSSDFGGAGKTKTKNMVRHSFFYTQMKKEATLFFRDPNLFSGCFGTFAVMPIFILVVDKIFGSMQSNIRGDMMILAFNVVILLLVSLSANTIAARIYSSEGDAFNLTRTYPGNEIFMVSSKIIWPGIIGSISVAISAAVFGSMKSIGGLSIFFVGTALVFAYLGHLLSSAGHDFTTKKDHFEDSDFASPAEKRSVVSAIVVSLVFGVLYYLYQTDFFTWGSLSRTETASVKIMLLGIGYFVICLIVFIKKITLIFKEGATI
ncbi:MAG: hypothetical protein MJ239_00360 [Bacilli bacterium]|nr:hypothetical protein [Bacilli bacterium]